MKKLIVSAALVLSFLFTFPVNSPAQKKKPRRLKASPVKKSSVGTARGGYVRGSRGGCYYVNRRGGKTYVDRSLCN